MSVHWYGLVPYIAGLAYAYLVSLALGFLVVEAFYDWARGRLPELVELPDDCGLPGSKGAVPPWVTGLVERAWVTTITLVHPAIALPAIAAWLSLKMAANWNKQIPGTQREQIIRARHAFLGLLSGAVSCGIAWLGGLLGLFIIDRWGP